MQAAEKGTEKKLDFSKYPYLVMEQYNNRSVKHPTCKRTNSPEP
jgi:hypothetical protein